jgi:hypothetical protein
MGRIAARNVVAHLKSERKLPTKNYASPTPAKSLTTKASDPESLRAWREVLRQLVTLKAAVAYCGKGPLDS